MFELLVNVYDDNWAANEATALIKLNNISLILYSYDKQMMVLLDKIIMK